jgi:hypothetical protein
MTWRRSGTTPLAGSRRDGTGMTVGRLAWQLLRLIARGGRNHRVVFVPMITDRDLRQAVHEHTGSQEWLARSVQPQPGDTFVITYLYLENLP